MVKSRDSNTSFFHKQAQNRRKKNTVISILSNTGQRLDTFEQVKEATSQHFESLYLQPNDEGSNEDIQAMLDNIPNIVSEHDNNQLVKEITEEEIVKAVWDMDPDKAPGPDGFSIRFYHSFGPS
jgi:hypothetical protein